MNGEDEWILGNVRDQLRWDERVDASHIRITVKEGRVSLAGFVFDFAGKQAAEEDALCLPAVRAVTNHLQVISEARHPGPSDEQIQAHIEDLLRWHAGIDASRAQVRVFDRCVTVKGTVDAVWKKTRIEELISGVFGVIDVNNALAVVPDRIIADRQITAAIVKALRRNRYVPAKSISVKVDDGRVILSGHVPDMVSYQSTCQSALITRGVRSVAHPMLIKRPDDR